MCIYTLHIIWVYIRVCAPSSTTLRRNKFQYLFFVIGHSALVSIHYTHKHTHTPTQIYIQILLHFRTQAKLLLRQQRRRRRRRRRRDGSINGARVFPAVLQVYTIKKLFEILAPNSFPKKKLRKNLKTCSNWMYLLRKNKYKFH